MKFTWISAPWWACWGRREAKAMGAQEPFLCDVRPSAISSNPALPAGIGPWRWSWPTTGSMETTQPSSCFHLSRTLHQTSRLLVRHGNSHTCRTRNHVITWCFFRRAFIMLCRAAVKVDRETLTRDQFTSAWSDCELLRLEPSSYRN